MYGKQLTSIQGRVRGPVAVLSVSADGTIYVRIDSDADPAFWVQASFTQQDIDDARAVCAAYDDGSDDND